MTTHAHTWRAAKPEGTERCACGAFRAIQAHARFQVIRQVSHELVAEGCQFSDGSFVTRLVDVDYEGLPGSGKELRELTEFTSAEWLTVSWLEMPVLGVEW